MFSFDTINILLAFVGAVTLALGFITLLSDSKDRTNRYFFFFVLAAFAWTLSILVYRGVSSEDAALFWARLLYLAAATIPLTFLYFSFTFKSNNYRVGFLKNVLIWVPYVAIGIISLSPSALIESVHFISGMEHVIVFRQYLHVIYGLYIDGYFLWIYVNLITKYFRSTGVTKTQLGYVILGTLASTLIGVTSNLILPLFGVFTFNWLGQVAVIFMVSAIFYSIYKHKLFNTKVVATELFIFALWGFILSRVVLADGFINQLSELALLFAVMAIGVLLIRSVIQEVATRERMEGLANELASANERLTALDQQKSEFLSIASHQLRSPLTAIKGYSSMILEGSFGPVTGDKLREAIDRIFLSSERLVIIIEDFLNVSRIEQGRMQYDFSTVNLEELVTGVITDLKPTIDKAGLTISFETKGHGPYMITADYGKVKQMVTNIIDNATKYTPKGGITVELDKDEETRKILLTVKDTGIGIKPEVIPMLFQKFTRDKKAGKVNIQGTGLGLYVVKELMKAHKGNVWVDSPGEGKGSTFYLEFMAE